jgi:hypothetical protein
MDPVASRLPLLGGFGFIGPFLKLRSAVCAAGYTSQRHEMVSAPPIRLGLATG